MNKPPFISLSDLSPMTPLSSFIDKMQGQKKDPVIVDFFDQNPFIFNQKLFVTENPSTLNQLPSINNLGSQIFDDVGKDYQHCYNLNTSNNNISNETPVVVKSDFPWLLGQSDMNVLSYFSMEGLQAKTQELEDPRRFDLGSSLKMKMTQEGGIGDNINGVFFQDMNIRRQQQQLNIANEINRSMNGENCIKLFGQENQIFKDGNNQKNNEDITGVSIASKFQEVLQHSISEEFTNDSCCSNAQGNNILQYNNSQVRIVHVSNIDSSFSNNGQQQPQIEISQGVNGSIHQLAHEQFDLKPQTPHLQSVFLPVGRTQSLRSQSISNSSEGMTQSLQPELYQQQANDFKVRIESIKQSMKERTQSLSLEIEKEEDKKNENQQHDQDESSAEMNDNKNEEQTDEDDEESQENSNKHQQFLKNPQQNHHQGTLETCLPSKPPPPTKNLLDYSRKVDFCNCRKTKCLKLYCDCFINGNFCNASCLCLECGNIPTNIPQRNQAIQEALSRNPEAFNQKFEVSNKEVAHRRGCTCSKTHCLKKYCECFNAGLKCKDNCKCEECENGKQDYQGNDHNRQMTLEGAVGVIAAITGGVDKQAQQSHRESSSTQAKSHETKISNSNIKRHHRDIVSVSDASGKSIILDDYKEPELRKKNNQQRSQQHHGEYIIQRQQQQQKAQKQQKQQ